MIRIAYRAIQIKDRQKTGKLFPWNTKNYVALNFLCRELHERFPEFHYWVENSDGIVMHAGDAPNKELTDEIRQFNREYKQDPEKFNPFPDDLDREMIEEIREWRESIYTLPLIRLAFSSSATGAAGKGGLSPWTQQSYEALVAWCKEMDHEYPELKHWIESEHGEILFKNKP